MRMGCELKWWIVLDCSGSVFHLWMDGLYGMRRSPFDGDWVNSVDSECGRIECAIFFQSSSTIHYGGIWRREGDWWFRTSTLCIDFVMIEKSTPTIQNVERTYGTIQPSILFFPSIPSILNESLSFQSIATPSPLSNHHFTPFTPMPSFHPSISIPLHFNHIHSNPSITPSPFIHSFTHHINNPNP